MGPEGFREAKAERTGSLQPEPPAPMGVCPTVGPKVLAALFAIMAVGLVLRFERARELPFWFDEAFSWRLSQAPWPDLLSRAARDNHSPFYFGLLKLWTGVFGTGPFQGRRHSSSCWASSLS